MNKLYKLKNPNINYANIYYSNINYANWGSAKPVGALQVVKWNLKTLNTFGRGVLVTGLVSPAVDVRPDFAIDCLDNRAVGASGPHAYTGITPWLILVGRNVVEKLGRIVLVR